MPALVHFQRKWLIASDDFVIPFAFEGFLRTVWLVGASVITWNENQECIENIFYVKYFLYSFIGYLIFTICLNFLISLISSKGSVLEDHKRVYLSEMLYAKCFTVVLDVVFASFCICLLLQIPNMCSHRKIFLQAAVVCFFLYVFAVILGIFICYNSLGSPFYWSSNNNNNSDKVLKKAKHVWYLRLNLFCCCANVNREEKDFTLLKISNFLTTVSKDIDFTPTDILAGLITLHKKHLVDRRKYRRLYNSDTLLAGKPIPSWMTADNALYFLKLAKIAYRGSTSFHSSKILCLLLYPWRCLKSFCNSGSSSTEGYCNSAFSEKTSGHLDILYASFSSLIYEPAFFVTVDHNKKSIIIAIRGTWSFTDLITDMDMEEMVFPGEVSTGKLKCHGGALRSALFIQKKLSKLQLLKRAFTENPSYLLVLTGHSLGASIAAILGLLLYPEYPSLQCYSFAPQAVLSEKGIAKTLDFVFGVVVENDMVPRLSVYSCKEVIKQIHASLKETQFPKYRILISAFWHYVKKSLKLTKVQVSSTLQSYENKQVTETDKLSFKEFQLNISSNETKLYAPGRILHLRRSERCNYSWITGYHLQNIIISPSVFKDHLPREIKFWLETYKQFLDKVDQSENSEQFKIEIT